MIKKFILSIFLVFGIALVSFGQANTVQVPHWQTSKISVYIPKEDKSALMMKRAFLKWQSASFGKLSFVFKNEGPANIDVVFVEKVDATDTPLGSYKTTVKNGYITKAEIKIANKNTKASNNMIYTTMLHEIGHALGLSDMDRKESTIMFMPLSEAQDITKLDQKRLFRIYDWNWLSK